MDKPSVVLFLFILAVVESSILPYNSCGHYALDKNSPPKWTVTIHQKGRAFCGATLISYDTAITTGECGEFVKKNPNLNVHVDSSPSSPSRYISKVIVHEDYTGRGISDKSIAILQLHTPFDEDEVDVLCLPKKDEDIMGKTCIFTGWGRNRHVEPTGDKMRFEMAKILPFDNCIDQIKHTASGSLLEEIQGFKGVICGGGKQYKGGCAGDSGGGLACKIGKRYEATGFMSFGATSVCELENAKDFFIDVGHNLNWIKRNMENM